MKSIREIGLKITAAQREYFRYTGPSAKLKQRGAGTSRPELVWVRRATQVEVPKEQANLRTTPTSPPPSADR